MELFIVLLHPIYQIHLLNKWAPNFYDLRNSKFNLEIPTAQNLNVQEQFCIHSCMDLECTSRTFLHLTKKASLAIKVK